MTFLRYKGGERDQHSCSQNCGISMYAPTVIGHQLCQMAHASILRRIPIDKENARPMITAVARVGCCLVGNWEVGATHS